jgi:hypothetical protein
LLGTVLPRIESPAPELFAADLFEQTFYTESTPPFLLRPEQFNQLMLTWLDRLAEAG